MNYLFHLDCIIKRIWRTIKTSKNIDGCIYKEVEVIENVIVTISKCKHCGKQDISWKFNK